MLAKKVDIYHYYVGCHVSEKDGPEKYVLYAPEIGVVVKDSDITKGVNRITEDITNLVRYTCNDATLFQRWKSEGRHLPAITWEESVRRVNSLITKVPSQYPASFIFKIGITV